MELAGAAASERGVPRPAQPDAGQGPRTAPRGRPSPDAPLVPGGEFLQALRLLMWSPFLCFPASLLVIASRAVFVVSHASLTQPPSVPAFTPLARRPQPSPARARAPPPPDQPNYCLVNQGPTKRCLCAGPPRREPRVQRHGAAVSSAACPAAGAGAADHRSSVCGVCGSTAP
jgi:hypothetical protein